MPENETDPVQAANDALDAEEVEAPAPVEEYFEIQAHPASPQAIADAMKTILSLKLQGGAAKQCCAAIDEAVSRIDPGVRFDIKVEVQVYPDEGGVETPTDDGEQSTDEDDASHGDKEPDSPAQGMMADSETKTGTGSEPASENETENHTD